jgi:hypothetical protein
MRDAAVTAAASRVCVVAASVAVGSLCRHFDASMSLLPSLEHTDAAVAETSSMSLSAALAPLACWDGVHFLGVAMAGYRNEHTFAFFPLYPYLCRALG